MYMMYIHISVISIFLRPEVGPTTSSYPEKGMREELDLQSPAMPGASIMGPTEGAKADLPPAWWLRIFRAEGTIFFFLQQTAKKAHETARK